MGSFSLLKEFAEHKGIQLGRFHVKETVIRKIIALQLDESDLVAYNVMNRPMTKRPMTKRSITKLLVDCEAAEAAVVNDENMSEGSPVSDLVQMQGLLRRSISYKTMSEEDEKLSEEPPASPLVRIQGLLRRTQSRMTEVSLDELKHQSNDFKDLARLHEEITLKDYPKVTLDQAWNEFVRQSGGYDKAQRKWFDCLQAKLAATHGKFEELKVLKAGRMGSAFKIKFQDGKYKGQTLCLKLPSSFGTKPGDKDENAWLENVAEYKVGCGTYKRNNYLEDQEIYPCDAIIEYIDIQHGVTGSSILLPLKGADLSDAALSSEQALPLMKILLEACNNLHYDMKRVHGDFTDGNVMTDNGGFVVIDVLAVHDETHKRGEHNYGNVTFDLRLMKDLPQQCFKAEVKELSDRIGQIVAAGGCCDNPKGKEGKMCRNKKCGKAFKQPCGSYFKKNMFGKAPKMTVGKFKKLAADLTTAGLAIPTPLSTRISALVEMIEAVYRISSHIAELCANASKTKCVKEASQIAAQVLKEFFSKKEE